VCGSCRAHVVVEEPGYPPARLLFESYGVPVTPVRVDARGLDESALPGEARLVYLTPSHQFPLGMPMTPARRAALLARAERRNAVLIEDDYDSECVAALRVSRHNSRRSLCIRVYWLGSDRGSPNHGSTLLSKRVMAQIRSPVSVRT
jgi:hypothetical protein